MSLWCHYYTIAAWHRQVICFFTSVN